MSKVVRFQSSNKEVLEAAECMVTMSKTIQTMLNRFQEDQVIMLPLEQVDSKTLTMVREWCENHVTKSTQKQYQFVEGLDVDVLLLLLKTANYLNIKELGDDMREAIAERARRKALEEIDPRILHTRVF
ncbi:PREDICTED: SKP1-like protein 14 [Fragaria vesca subsp. vesca]|uniref:SKP1-like protein 14 n=1 Tax=Fragaria vesca subsp. vesca TaxID=101020 RepID=UPI0002C31366|nr:PREDICTED: SKP1-like protein 14 [Fragaria vesca subsp. vesca]